MKAVVLEAVNRAVVKELPEPAPGPGQVLVKVEASGLCATDYDLIRGHTPIAGLPRILGHQGAGRVSACGPEVSGFQPGERVVISIDVPCGDCAYCRQGRPNICRNLQRIGFERDGSHAGYVLVPAANLVRLPELIPFPEGAILADAVASMYHALIGRAKLRAGEKVLLLGIGGVSIHGVQLARLCGAEVLVTSRQPERLQAALNQGAARAVDPEKEDLRRAVREFTGGEGVDLVMDAIGLEGSLQLALEVLRPGGRVLAFGNVQPSFTANYTDLFLREKDILGVRANTKEDLLAVTALVAAGKLKPIVSRLLPLAEFHQGLQAIETNSLVGRAVFIC